MKGLHLFLEMFDQNLIDTFLRGTPLVRLKSANASLLLIGQGDNGGANSALLYYQITRPTKLSLASFNQVIG